MANRAKDILVSPAFALEMRDLLDFQELFGPYAGQYIRRFPYAWIDALLRHVEDSHIIESVGPVQKKALKEKFYKAVEVSVIPAPASFRWSDGLGWAENVKSVQCLVEDGVIVGDGLDPSPFCAWVEALAEIRSRKKTSWQFYSRVEDYLEAVTPLVQISPAAYLVDPYFDPLSRESEILLRSVFERMRGSRCARLGIITRQKSIGGGAPDFDDRIRRVYHDLVPNDREFIVYPVYDSGDMDFHDRFFLTRHGGIGFGRSVEIETARLPQRTAFLLDRELHYRIKKTYIDGVVCWGNRAQNLEDVPRPRSVAPPVVVPRNRR
jgi:hypothetical protein